MLSWLKVLFLELWLPVLAIDGFFNIWCRCAYTGVLLSELNSSFTSTTIPHGLATAKMPVEIFGFKFFFHYCNIEYCVIMLVQSWQKDHVYQVYYGNDWLEIPYIVYIMDHVSYSVPRPIHRLMHRLIYWSLLDRPLTDTLLTCWWTVDRVSTDVSVEHLLMLAEVAFSFKGPF